MIAIDASALLSQNPTGVENYCRSILGALRGELVDDSVGLYAGGDRPADFDLPANWQWRRLNFWLPKGWTHLRFSIELFLHPPTRLFIPAHEIPIGVRRARTEVTVMVHDVAFLRDKQNYSLLGNWRQRFNLANVKRVATNVIVPTQAVKNDLVDLANFDPGRITVIAEGPTLGGDARRDGQLTVQGDVAEGEPGIGNGAEYWLFVGRIEYKKGVDLLLAAYRQLSATRELPVLKLVGKDGFGAEDIRAVNFVPPGVGMAVVEWLGYVSDDELARLYDGAKIFIFPSRAEGFGLPVLDAWGAGVPVIASDINAFKELAQVDSGEETPIAFFESGSEQDLVRALIEIDSNYSRRIELIAAGRKQLLKYSWEKAAKETAQLLCR